MFKVSDFPSLLLSEFDPQTPVSRLQPRESKGIRSEWKHISRVAAAALIFLHEGIDQKE